MTTVTPQQPGLRHSVFLGRLAAATRDADLEARFAKGALLVLRLVELLAPDRPPPDPDAFRYQARATARCCGELPPDRTETNHLVGLLRVAADAYEERNVQLVVPALLAYAHYLEDELRLEEALDVLGTLVDVGADRLGSTDAIAVRLRIGRVNRKLNRFDAGDAAYAAAAELAEVTGDLHSALLSRIGRAISTQARGNLGEAERLLRALSAEARAANDRDIAARALHTLGTTLLLRGQAAEGIAHVWQAVGLYEDGSSRLRALNDLGVMLLAIGRVDDAERALDEVIRSDDVRDNVSNALIELMHCASFRRDRVGFERRRAVCESRRQRMPPNILADFYFKAGIGTARFGNLDRAHALMADALKIAKQHRLRELEFRVERVMAGLRDCETGRTTESPEVAEPAVPTKALQEVSAGLARMPSDRYWGC